MGSLQKICSFKSMVAKPVKLAKAAMVQGWI
jgi:hypothetical protein